MEALLILLVLYWVPIIVALARRRIGIGPIVVVNLFLGWTFVGWVVALAMAAGGKTKPMAEVVWSDPKDKAA